MSELPESAVSIEGENAARRADLQAWLRLCLYSAAALGVFRGIDSSLFRLLAGNPALALVADLRVTSLAAIALAVALSRPP